METNKFSDLLTNLTGMGPKDRRIALALALLGTITPISGLHKFYLGQPLWGLIYLALFATPIPQIASAVDLVWYLVKGHEGGQFNGGLGAWLDRPAVDPQVQQMPAIAEAIRQLEQLRQEGLVSEYEFEQKRRQLLDRLS